MATTKQIMIPVHNFKIHGNELNCMLDQERKPFVKFNNSTYHTLLGLLKAAPFLEEKENFNELAYLVNFLTKGLEFKFIEDITSYQEQYLNRVEFEQNSFDYIPKRIIDHGVFNVAVMHPPRIEKENFVFYVKEDHTGLPYCVRCTFPIQSQQQIRYELLPYAE